MGWRAGQRRRHPSRLAITLGLLGRNRLLGLGVLLSLATTSATAATVGARPDPAASGRVPTRVGFSFRPHTVAGMGLDPVQALRTLLQRTDADLVRLPIYWSDVAPSADRLDFATVDRLLAVVGAHDLEPGARTTRVVLIVGMRNEGYPELFVPSWALQRTGLNTAALSAQPEYSRYLTAAISRYAGLPLLDSWQVENEPMDSSVPADEGDTSVSAADVEREVSLLHARDGRHQVMVTSFNSSTVDLDEVGIAEDESGAPAPIGAQPGGHPNQSLRAGDILGLDLYVVYAGVDLGAVDVATRITWKRNSLDFWAARAQAAGRSLWIAEMQAAPWRDVPGFTPADLTLSAEEYCGRGASTVLLWGIEVWLTLEGWQEAGDAAVATLRSPQCGLDPQPVQTG